MPGLFVAAGHAYFARMSVRKRRLDRFPILSTRPLHRHNGVDAVTMGRYSAEYPQAAIPSRSVIFLR
jgi:hypothetical protein